MKDIILTKAAMPGSLGGFKKKTDAPWELEYLPQRIHGTGIFTCI